jgi:hypothetical protein
MTLIIAKILAPGGMNIDIKSEASAPDKRVIESGIS